MSVRTIPDMAAASANSSSAAASASSSGSGSGGPDMPVAEAAEKKASASPYACPICLEDFKDEAYLDTCFHSFCFKCIRQWVKIVGSKHVDPLSSVKCPLCKTENLSTIHAFDGESYERWYINQEPRKRRLSDAHELISQFYNMEEIASDVSSVQQYWKQHKYLRKNIWLQTWLRREIQALTRDENVEAIVYHIHGVVKSFMKRHKRDHTSRSITAEERREEFKILLSDAARPFLLGRTERFVRESSFLGRTASGSSASSHRSVYRSYVFGRDESNSSSRSCMSISESNSEMDQTNSNQPKKAKFSSSQPKPTESKTNSEGLVFPYLRSCAGLRLALINKSTAVRKAALRSRRVKLRISSQHSTYQGDSPGLE